jgi:hypothetical protein
VFRAKGARPLRCDDDAPGTTLGAQAEMESAMHRKIPKSLIVSLALFMWHFARKRPAPAPAGRFSWAALKPWITNHR